MGMKTIEAKKKEYEARAASFGAFVDVAEKVRDEVAKLHDAGSKLENALEESWKRRQAFLPKVEKIKTHGHKPYEQLVANLLAVCKGQSDRLLPMPPGRGAPWEYYEVTQAISAQLKKIHEAAAKQRAAIEGLYAKKQKLVPIVQKIETHGIKEFESYKKSLLAICKSESYQDRPLPIAPLRKHVSEARKESSDLLKAWMEKQTAKMPKVIKKGMTFRDYRLDRVYEAVSGEKKSTNPNLSGEGAIFVDCKWTDLKTGKAGGGALPMSREQLSPKNKVKFLKV